MNENDAKLIEYCRGSPKDMKQISKHLSISVKSVSLKIKALQERDLVRVKKNPILKKIVVQTKQNKEIEAELNRLISIIKDAGGEITKSALYEKAFEKIKDPFSERGYLINQALIQLTFSKFVQPVLKLNEDYLSLK